MKKGIVILSLCAITFAIVHLFWIQEAKYLRPTPVPKNFKDIPVGQVMHPIEIELKSRPMLVHFYNPNCPCSKFNQTHYESLVRKYKNSIDFSIVIQQKVLKKGQAEEIKESLPNTVDTYFDEDEVIAKSCGVYATPQAVLITAEKKLFYKGNYNKARYCSNKTTKFAEIAIDSLLAGSPPPIFDHFATTPYGCELNKQNTLADNFNL